MWKSRVAAWKASGQTAEVFAEKQGLMAGTLRWWASRLRREQRQSDGSSSVRLARVVRTERSAAQSEPVSTMAIELRDLHARITFEGRVDRDALTTVLAVLRAGAR